eukprot:1975903-Amphidinium_carterae.2
MQDFVPGYCLPQLQEFIGSRQGTTLYVVLGRPTYCTSVNLLPHPLPQGWTALPHLEDFYVCEITQATGHQIGSVQ